MKILKKDRIPYRVRRRVKKILYDLLEPDPEMIPLPTGTGKPRVLIILQAYPNFSETYMHEEIRSLCEQFEIRVITYEKSGRARRRAWQHQLIKYRAPNFAYANIDDINLEFDRPKQQDFLRQVGAVIEEFKPHVMHCHYLGLGLLMKKLAEDHRIPFTMRTHSVDILSEPTRKLEACCEALNSPWCLRVLAFPESRKRLIEHGMNPEKGVDCWPVLKFEAFYKPEKRPPTGRILCCGPAVRKKAHTDFVDLAALMRGRSDFEFDLYAKGPTVDDTRAYNAKRGKVINISYADPEDMPDVYPRYDWLIYPADPAINKVGLPVGIIEAQASGIGVCWQELPGRRQEQLDFLGGGGFLYKSLDEIPEILSRPYPEEMREAGFEAARRCDIEQHKHLLSEVWESVAAESGAASVHAGH